ncbi:MAG TPA: threonine--tRNA ligase [Mycobacteriales bacterium]|nr:threonine--tRNA ligase [Mycobacteriales bacterium]
MSTISVTVADQPQTVAAGTTAGQALADAGIKDAVVARVAAAGEAGALRDLAHVLADGDVVEGVPAGSEDGRAVLRHSCAHVLAQAVQDLFPGTKLGIGPPIRDGFYYDFLPERPFTPEDLAALEKRMSDIIRQRQRFARREVTDDAARAELAHEPFKLELIGLKGGGMGGDEGDAETAVEVGGGQLTMYDNLVGEERAWTDLCRGPHLPTTRDIPAFKLTRSAAAYWRGSEKNPQLQRIYGTAWESKDALKDHLFRLEEAERRDHRRLGAELDLFSFPDEIGSGLAVFHPKGGVIRRVMEEYSRRKHEDAGYSFVNTPHITKGHLFEISQHLNWYSEGMFPPMHLDQVGEKGGSDYYLKPMNCPMHNLIFRSRGRSYRELPLRLFEFGTVYRYEKSGVVHGLARGRGFTQDDSHIYCTLEQMPGELTSLLDFVLELLRDYGLDDFYLELSTRDDSPKFIGDDESWATATAALEAAAKASGLELVPDPGGAAFYGPKISVQARDAIGRSWQMSTIQVDFNQPKLFELEFADDHGGRQQPVMIHRALFGSIERFFAVLLEHYAGAFPVWLAPVQVVGIPVAERHVGYFEQTVLPALQAKGVRAEVDASDERMQKKIRNAQQQKVPYMLIVGDDDETAGAVSFRYRDGSTKNGVPLADAVAEIVSAIDERRQV